MKKITLLLVLMMVSISHAQDNEVNAENCIKKTKQARMYLFGNDIIVQDIPLAMESLITLADSGCVNAQYELGKIYRDGKHVDADENLAFEYFQLAVDQEYPKAIAQFGTLYQQGIGTTLNYEKAIELYQKANDLDDGGMGAYFLGYNYFKGLGPIEQNYVEAVKWFSLSEYPMAIHFLGLMNYFGYGMPVNKQAAYELLVNNTSIKNSLALLNHLEASKEIEESVLSDYKGINVTAETEKINNLLEDDENLSIEETKNKPLTTSQLKGKWTGKLVELDWSSERVLRMLPVSLDISKSKFTDTLIVNAEVENSKANGEAILLDDSIYFENFNVDISRIYTDQENVSSLKYSILNSDIKLKTINHIQFLAGYVDTKILDWNEPGPPMLLVLSNDTVLTDNGLEISKELIDALIAQEGNNFINLYPNPFKDDLLIQYELTQESTASVEIYSLDGSFSQVITNQQVQSAGKQLFQYNGAALRQGAYVIRVIANGKAYTKIIIKEN